MGGYKGNMTFKIENKACVGTQQWEIPRLFHKHHGFIVMSDEMGFFMFILTEIIGFGHINLFLSN